LAKGKLALASKNFKNLQLLATAFQTTRLCQLCERTCVREGIYKHDLDTLC